VVQLVDTLNLSKCALHLLKMASAIQNVTIDPSKESKFYFFKNI